MRYEVILLPSDFSRFSMVASKENADLAHQQHFLPHFPDDKNRDGRHFMQMATRCSQREKRAQQQQ